MSDVVKVHFKRGNGVQDSTDGVFSVDKNTNQLYLGDGEHAWRIGDQTTEQLQEKLDGTYLSKDDVISDALINAICQ